MAKSSAKKTTQNWFTGQHLSFLLLTALGFVLLLVRLVWSWDSIYFFLAWNIILAWIPLLCAESLVLVEKKFRSPILVWVALAVWLLFFPNAPYIITDYIHLINLRDTTPLWFDLILITTFAWLGLMLGFASLSKVQEFVNKKFTIAHGWLVAVVTIVLASFGIFVGRYLRWNSWDVVANPKLIISDLWQLVTDPSLWFNALGVTVFFSLFLFLAYRTLQIPVITQTTAPAKKRR